MLGVHPLYRLPLPQNAADKLHPDQVTNSSLNTAFLWHTLVGKKGKITVLAYL